MRPRRSSIVGTTVGFWFVVSEAPPSPRGDEQVTVRCRCNRQRTIAAKELRRGKSKSCGCSKGTNIAATKNGSAFALPDSAPDNLAGVVFVLDGVTIRQRDIERFVAMVDRRGPLECWPWRGRPNRGGYGRISVRGRHIIAPRLALSLRLGRPLGPEEVTRHTCDNAICTNGEHLIEGSPVQNVGDAVERKRMAAGDRHGMRKHPERRARGQHHGRSRLAEATVIEILSAARDGAKPREIAVRFGISVGHAGDIIHGRTWSHLHTGRKP